VLALYDLDGSELPLGVREENAHMRARLEEWAGPEPCCETGEAAARVLLAELGGEGVST
jgi:hypothetical protein